MLLRCTADAWALTSECMGTGGDRGMRPEQDRRAAYPCVGRSARLIFVPDRELDVVKRRSLACSYPDGYGMGRRVRSHRSAHRRPCRSGSFRPAGRAIRLDRNPDAPRRSGCRPQPDNANSASRYRRRTIRLRSRVGSTPRMTDIAGWPVRYANVPKGAGSAHVGMVRMTPAHPFIPWPVTGPARAHDLTRTRKTDATPVRG